MVNLLTFMIDNQPYALLAESVSHVIHMIQIVPLPDLPPAVSGIINFHGDIIPVYSIRRKIGLIDKILTTNVLILTKTQTRTIALVADAVGDVLDYQDEIITSDVIHLDTPGISGIIRTQNGMILIHDPDKFLSASEEEMMNRVIPYEHHDI
jgi:purine-binding chemotaxis protein CheW